MRDMRGFIVGVLMAGFLAVACRAKPAAPQKVATAKYKVSGVMHAMAGGGLTIERQASCTYADGSSNVAFRYLGSSGSDLFVRTLNVSADGSKVTDDRGITVLAPVPAALQAARAAYATQVEAMVSSYASSGKASP